MAAPLSRACKALLQPHQPAPARQPQLTHEQGHGPHEKGGGAHGEQAGAQRGFGAQALVRAQACYAGGHCRQEDQAHVLRQALAAGLLGVTGDTQRRAAAAAGASTELGHGGRAPSLPSSTCSSGAPAGHPRPHAPAPAPLQRAAWTAGRTRPGAPPRRGRTTCTAGGGRRRRRRTSVGCARGVSSACTAGRHPRTPPQGAAAPLGSPRPS